MKKRIILLVTLSLLAACNKPTSNEEIEVETETTVKEVDIIQDGMRTTKLEIDSEEKIYHLNNDLDLSFKSSLEEAPFCEDKCLISKEILLNDKHLKVLEEMSVPINSDYGTASLTNIDDLYILAFDPAAQLAGFTVVIFDDSGNVLKEFNNVGINLNNIENKTFEIHYPCEEGEDGCNPMMNPFSSFTSFTVNGKELIEELRNLKDEQLESIREAAKEANAIASIAVIGDAYEKSVKEVLDNSVYPELYSFIKEIDEAHTIEISGLNLFCIIPTDPSEKMTVVEIAGDNRNILYESDDGKPILAISDNHTIEVHVGDNEFMLEPIYGVTTLGESVLYDFTFRNGANLTPYDILLTSVPELIDYAISDDSFTDIESINDQQCYLAYFGTQHETGEFTRERTFAISEDSTCVYEYDVVNDTWNKIN